MSTYSELVARIRDDLDRGTNYDDDIRDAIYGAVQFWEHNNFGFNIRIANFETTSRYTTLSADIISITRLRIYDGGNLYVVQPENYLTLDEIDTRPTDGSRPTRWAMEARLLRLYPAPDQTYSFDANVVYRVAGIESPSASDDVSNAWTNEARELVRFQAAVDVLETKIKGPDAVQDAMVLRQRLSQVLHQLQARAGRDQKTGGITPWL